MTKASVKYLLGGFSEESRTAYFKSYREAKDFLENLCESEETFTVGKVEFNGDVIFTLRSDGKKIYSKLGKSAAKIEAEIEGIDAESNAEFKPSRDIEEIMAVANVIPENEVETKQAQGVESSRDFIKNVLSIDEGDKITITPQKNCEVSQMSTSLTQRDLEFGNFDCLKMSDDLYHVRICRAGHYTLSSVAIYQTEKQVQDVLKMLGAAITRGEKTFQFPTVAELKNFQAKEKLQFNLNAIGSTQREWKKAYHEGKMQIATELFETLKIFYRAYTDSRAKIKNAA